MACKKMLAQSLDKKKCNKEVRHNIMRKLGEVMYMETFGKSVLETFEDAQQKIL